MVGDIIHNAMDTTQLEIAWGDEMKYQGNRLVENKLKFMIPFTSFYTEVHSGQQTIVIETSRHSEKSACSKWIWHYSNAFRYFALNCLD